MLRELRSCIRTRATRSLAAAFVLSLVSASAGWAQIIIDNGGAGFTTGGAWTASTGATGYYGSNFLHDGNAGVDAGKWAKWKPTFPSTGSYTVYARWSAHANRPSNVRYRISHQGTVTDVFRSQQVSGGTWVSLGTFTFGAGNSESNRVTLDAGSAAGYVVADAVQFTGGTTPPGGGGGSGLGSILSQAQFNQMFPNRNAFYTYQGLLTAAARYPTFAGTGDTAARRREAAAAMANFSHETGGLVHVTEIAQGEYCSGTATPCGVCAAGKRYYGRGPIQLSWNFNYCSAGQALGLNLWADPDLAQRDPAVAWATALWYWMTQNGPGSQPAHSCMTSNAGFGCTIRSINGSLECNGGNPAQVQSRINNYTNFKNILGAGGSVGADGC